MKILLAVDGSDYTKRMLAYLAAHEELLGARHSYTVLTVVPAVPMYAAEYLDKSMLDQYQSDQSERALGPIRGFVDLQGWKADFVSASGHAPDVIAAHAEAGKYDLLAMGSHGHGSMMNMVLGSVATRVIASCKVPVLLIR
jgi:nucleotide-binding universal stress UspA family protein